MYPFLVSVMLLLTLTASGADLHVPDEYTTIQAAVNASVDGDRVIVESGTYYENITVDKSITLTSTDPNDPNTVANTIIDAAGSGTVVTFPDVASADCVLAGFTVANGDTSVNGGGMLCLNGSIEINNCIISDNTATENGGGIYTEYANLTLTSCVFSRNSASGVGNLAGGGGIFTRYGELILTDCQFNNNTAVNSSGGGIRCTDAELTLAGSTFVSNSSVREGGGVSTDAERATLTDCKFNGNSAKYGGGMCNSHRGATVTNCVFASNTAERGGGICALQTHSGDLSLNNCTFSGNSADYYGGAVCDEEGGTSVLTNCIFWENIAYVEGPQIALEQDGTTSVSYCCIQGGDLDIYTGSGSTVSWLVGNITSDPYFADPCSGDFHLQSMAGRWDTDSDAWVIDGNHSPCIDTGDPNSDWTEEVWPNGQCINMGAFGGTNQASKSLATSGNIADINSSGTVDEADLKLLAGKWLRVEVLPEDLNGDEIVNLGDFAVLANNWCWPE
jgi:predicted outer membrane repeat protein/parallel beta-helix repeat protein